MTARQVRGGTHRTVVEVLRAAAEVNGDVEAYVEPAAVAGGARRALTFGEWDRCADGVAGLLARHGVGRGDVVCLLLPSSIDFAVTYAAVQRLGAVTSAVNPRLGPNEVASILLRSGPEVTVVDPDLGAVPAGAGGTLVERSALAGASGGPPAPARTLHEDDPVAVVWTSGTTGRPKGAVFDHRNLAAVAAGTDVLSQPGDRRLSPLPFAHVGYMTRAWDEIAHGVTTVITPTPWRAAEALRILAEERITVAQGVPTQWALVLALPGPDRLDLPAIRIAGTGAARVPATLVAEMRRRLGVPVVVRYTSTEASLGTGTDPGDPDEVVAVTVGRPVRGVELSVVDGAGRPVPPGAVGRVRLRSGAVMRGYWGDAGHPMDTGATSAVLGEDRWLTTGDFGLVRADGNLQLVGRADELYIRGGYNVYPAEVEAVLGACPGVAQVAVVGAPDDVLGEVGVAFAVPSGRAGGARPTLAGLRAHCRACLADYKAPDRLVLVDALPVTPMMKVDKRALAGPAAAAAAGRSTDVDPNKESR